MFRRGSFSVVAVVYFAILLSDRLLCVWSQPKGRTPDVSFSYDAFDDSDAKSLLLAGDVTMVTGSNAKLGGTIALVSRGKAWASYEDTRTYAGRMLQNLGISMTNKSFSTEFTFSMERVESTGRYGEDGLAFVLVSNPNAGVSGLPGSFGLFDSSGLADDVALAVEFDTFQNPSFNDPEHPHVGVDRFNIRSEETKEITFLCLNCGRAITAWIDYSNWNQRLEVRIASFSDSAAPVKPAESLLNLDLDLSSSISPVMWAGFGASTTNFPNSSQSHFIHRWTFQTFNESSPSWGMNRSSTRKVDLWVGLGVGIGALGLIACLSMAILKCPRLRGSIRSIGRSSSRQVDDDILQMVDGPHKFSYRELSRATDNFSDDAKLGEGGFGNVYRGVFRDTRQEVAVKFMGREARHGLKEFLAEISIISKLRHRHLVQLLGYCTDDSKFLIAYEYMPLGSLDKHLLMEDPVLSWERRFRIVKGVAAALDYLHEGWRQQVIHRDVKPSNVMLDKDYVAKLGDFGLARLREHQIVPKTTKIAGTWGYIAPELVYTGKATNKTDVYSYGAMILEIASGKPVVDRSATSTESVLLLDVIWNHRRTGDILRAADQRLGGKFDRAEMETVLLMGLLCSHPEPERRPTMRQLLQIFDGDAPVPFVPMARPVQTFMSPLFPGDDFPLCSSSVETVNSSLFGSSTTVDSSSKATPTSDLNGRIRF